MSSIKITEGIRGEDLACQYLKDKRYNIIDRNYRLKGGEIDIIAIKNEILVFVEVKTRKTKRFGTGLEAITPWKLKSLVKAANYYKVCNRNLPDQMRIDAISIDLDHQGRIDKIEHIENITF